MSFLLRPALALAMAGQWPSQFSIYPQIKLETELYPRSGENHNLGNEGLCFMIAYTIHPKAGYLIYLYWILLLKENKHSGKNEQRTKESSVTLITGLHYLWFSKHGKYVFFSRQNWKLKVWKMSKCVTSSSSLAGLQLGAGRQETWQLFHPPWPQLRIIIIIVCYIIIIIIAKTSSSSLLKPPSALHNIIIFVRQSNKVAFTYMRG